MRISDWSSDVCSSDLNCRGPCATSHDALRGGICLSRRPFNLSNAIWRCEFEDYRPSNGPRPPVGPPTLGKRKWRSLRLPGDQLPSLYGKVTALSPTAPLRPSKTLRSEEQTSELTTLKRTSYDGLCLNKKIIITYESA